MCLFGGGGGGQTAMPPAPVPPPPVEPKTPQSPEIDDARQRELDRRRAMMSPQATVATSGRGLADDANTGKTKLGG